MELRVTNPELERFVAEELASGRFSSADELVSTALLQMKHAQTFGDFEPGELDKLIEEGETSGHPIDGEAVFAELRKLREQATARQ